MKRLIANRDGSASGDLDAFPVARGADGMSFNDWSLANSPARRVIRASIDAAIAAGHPAWFVKNSLVNARPARLAA